MKVWLGLIAGRVVAVVLLALAPSLPQVPVPLERPASPAATAVQPGPALFAEELRARLGIPGLAAAAVVRGHLVWSEGFGLAEVENPVAVWPDTRFRIGSVSKLITAAALGRLSEQGRLDLDAPIQRYVPSFPDKGAPITLRLLSGHLAGIRHYERRDFPEKSWPTVLAGLAVFKDDPLLQPPGSRYSYSSYGYNVVGSAIEAATGKPFPAAIEELVLQPLALRHTTADDPAAPLPRRTGYYTRDSAGRLRQEAAIDSRYKWPAGGMLSTAEDLARFGAAHLREGFLRSQTRQLLFTPQRTAGGEPTGVGIGWRIGRSRSGRSILHHGGAIEGGRAFLLLLREHDVAVALTANLSGAGFDQTQAEELAELFLK